jgi:uracil-DNA glycosylase
MKILFIGSNPSQVSAKTVPFWFDTRSRSVLFQWMDQVEESEIIDWHFANVSNQVTPDNRSLKMSEIKENLETLKANIESINPDKIITLGKTAEKALTLLNREFYPMPHPSGRNRKLNNKDYIEEKIKGMTSYIIPSKV